jgi:hypothetical protein
MNKEEQGILFVDHAGEILHRLTGPVAAKE